MTGLGLRIRHLDKSFTVHRAGRTVTGLRDVSLDVGPGEHVTLLGPSGCGKSTLLRCIYGTYRPSGGSILLDDARGHTKDLGALSPTQLADLRTTELGYVSQFLAPEPRRTPLGIVIRAAQSRGATAAEAADAAREILARLALDPTMWELPASLISGGEKQRVNIARCLVVPPRLLLLDEPTASLDPENTARVMSHIRGLSRAGSTVISVLHDAELASAVADRTVTLHRPKPAEEVPS